MIEETLETETLEDLAEKIARYATEADERTLEAAKLIREARNRVEAGEAGEVKWYEWGRKNIRLSMPRLRELQRIGAAEDPQKELEHLRRKIWERVERHRKNKSSARLPSGGAPAKVTAEMKDGRKSLIDWARTALLDRVTEVLSYIRGFDSATAVSNPNQPAEPAAM